MKNFDNPVPRSRMWGGRFPGPTDALVAEFNASIGVDHLMALEDIEGSIAHATMLAEQGIITTEESEQIVEALAAIRQDVLKGSMEWRIEDEDVHMNLERALTDRIGPLGGKLHTARSRNDQVATDLRLWIRAATKQIIQQLHALRCVLVDAAEVHLGVIIPGYTICRSRSPCYSRTMCWPTMKCSREIRSDSKNRSPA